MKIEKQQILSTKYSISKVIQTSNSIIQSELLLDCSDSDGQAKNELFPSNSSPETREKPKPKKGICFHITNWKKMEDINIDYLSK